MRIVLDTNLLVSAILSPKGNPAKIIHLVLDGNATLIISKPILLEIDRVFRYPKIKKLLKMNQVSTREVNEFLKIRQSSGGDHTPSRLFFRSCLYVFADIELCMQ